MIINKYIERKKKGNPEHLANLVRVLNRISTVGLKLRPDKCLFMQPTVTYCVSPWMVDAIKDTPESKNVSYELSWVCATTTTVSYLM